MIGIYCWTNQINNKKYVGQSTDIMKRKMAHLASVNYTDSLLIRAFKKYGIQNFTFEILEIVEIEELNDKERFYIEKLESYYTSGKGYNMTRGGQDSLNGESNPNSSLTDEEVLEIRTRIFIKKEGTKEVYQDFKEKISYDRFWSALHGESFKNVDTSMIYPLKANIKGSLNGRALLNEEDVLHIRNLVYIEKVEPLEVYDQFKEKISYSAFRKAMKGETWKSVDTSMISEISIKRKGKPKAKITKKEVAQIRFEFENNIKTLNDLYKEYSFVSNTTILRIVKYETWKDIKPVSTIPEA